MLVARPDSRDQVDRLRPAVEHRLGAQVDREPAVRRARLPPDHRRLVEHGTARRRGRPGSGSTRRRPLTPRRRRRRAAWRGRRCSGSPSHREVPCTASTTAGQDVRIGRRRDPVTEVEDVPGRGSLGDDLPYLAPPPATARRVRPGRGCPAPRVGRGDPAAASSSGPASRADDLGAGGAHQASSPPVPTPKGSAAHRGRRCPETGAAVGQYVGPVVRAADSAPAHESNS